MSRNNICEAQTRHMIPLNYYRCRRVSVDVLPDHRYFLGFTEVCDFFKF